MKRTGDPNDDRIMLSIGGREHDIPVTVTDVDGLTSYRIPLDLGALGRHDIVLDLFHPDHEPDEDPGTEPQSESDNRPRRIVHTLGEDERNGLWACTEPPTWKAFYAWQKRNPALHDGDDSPAWHYSPGQRAEHGYWSMARSGTEDTTAKTIGPLGDIERATFVEVARLQPDGSLTYFGDDGSQWTLGGRPTDEG